MTEKEADLLTLVGDQFGVDLAKITAKALKKFRNEVHAEVLRHLQDSTSLYSPYVANWIEEFMRSKK